MKTIQVVLDKELLLAADREARRTKKNRSSLIRDALRQHLRRLRVRRMEDLDRGGYLGRPHVHRESREWEAEASWPDE